MTSVIYSISKKQIIKVFSVWTVFFCWRFVFTHFLAVINSILLNLNPLLSSRTHCSVSTASEAGNTRQPANEVHDTFSVSQLISWWDRQYSGWKDPLDSPLKLLYDAERLFNSEHPETRVTTWVLIWVTADLGWSATKSIISGWVCVPLGLLAADREAQC